MDGREYGCLQRHLQQGGGQRAAASSTQGCSLSKALVHRGCSVTLSKEVAAPETSALARSPSRMASRFSRQNARVEAMAGCSNLVWDDGGTVS